MQMFAVIYSIDYDGNYASSPEIAGVYVNESIANTIAKTVGGNAKVVPIILNEVKNTHVNVVKQNFNIDIITLVKEENFGLKNLNSLDCECLMSSQEFLEDVSLGCITSDDGSGYWATETQISEVSCWNSMPEWATHVCWFNK